MKISEQCYVFIYSQSLCVNRFLSLEKDFNYHNSSMNELCMFRGYPEAGKENCLCRYLASAAEKSNLSNTQKPLPG